MSYLHRKLKNVLLILPFLAFFFPAGAQSVYVGKSGSEGKALMKYIDPAELKKLIENPVDSIWIIDVRSEKAYASGHIPTAKSFPAITIKSRFNEIPKNQYLIIYCTVGANAQIVSKSLKKAGYKRYMNFGGITRWVGTKEVSNKN